MCAGGGGGVEGERNVRKRWEGVSQGEGREGGTGGRGAARGQRNRMRITVRHQALEGTEDELSSRQGNQSRS